MLCQYFADRLSDGRKPGEQRQCELVSFSSNAFTATAVQLLYVPPERYHRRFFSPDYLFLCYVSELPEDPADAPMLCVCLADRELPPQYRSPDYGKTLFLLESTGAPEELLHMLEYISFILSEDMRYYYAKDALLSAEKEQIGLHRALTLIESVFKNPVMLVGESGVVLGHSSKYQFADADVRQALVDGVINVPLMERIQRSSMSEDFVANYPATYHQGMPIITLYLRLSIRVEGMRVATLIVGKDNAQFLYSAMLLVGEIQEFLAQVFSRISSEEDRRAMLHNLLFSELLTDDSDSPQIRQQIQRMGWRQVGGMQLLLCVPNHEETEIHKLDRPFAAVRQSFPHCRWRIQDGTLILLCYLEDRMEPDALTGLLRRHRLKAGISWPLDDLTRLRTALHQAQAALELGHGVLNTYASSFCVDIYRREPAEWLRYLHPAAVKLADYDRQKQAVLLPTLEQYLLGSQVSEVTAALHIQRSTLFYRLDQMRRIAPELALDGGGERLNLLLSIKLLRRLAEAGLFEA